MRLDDYPGRTGKRVWLTREEVERLIDSTETAEQRIALKLGGQAGLRRSEIVSVTMADFQHAPDGFVRVWGDYAKMDKYREAPIPDGLEPLVVGYTSGSDAESPVVDRAGSTVYRWLRKAADAIQAETGDEGWEYLDVHDLRRSWGGHLLWNCGVSPMSVMEFGGWSDWSTFEEHYMGEMTPEARDRERSKIDWAGGDPEPELASFEAPKDSGAAEAYRAD
jgi:integrase